MRWGEKAPFACLWVSWETSQKSTGSAGNMSAFYRPGAGNTRGNVTKSRRPPRGFFVFTRSFRLFPAYLFIMQAIRPPFSFSPCRKRKRSPAAKRKRALSMVWTKGPFNRAFCEPQVHTGHRLKAYVPFRTLSRLLWQFVQLGGITISDRKPACFVLHCTASNSQRLCHAFGTAGISGRASGGAQKTFRLRQPFPSLPRCGFLLFVKRRKGQRQLAVK